MESPREDTPVSSLVAYFKQTAFSPGKIEGKIRDLALLSHFL